MIDDLSNRRGYLMEQALDEHFSSQFFDSWPKLKEYKQKLQQQQQHHHQDTTTLIDNESIEKFKSNPGNLRWREYDPNSKTGDAICYYFSEKWDSYWSFQWCPKARAVNQGPRLKNGLFEPEYSLGSGHTPLKSFKEAMYPTAESIYAYVNGDSCVEGGSTRRSSLIVVHKSTSAKCRKREGTEMIIESVEEVQVCQYVLHICKDRQNNDPAISDNDDDDAKTSSSFPEFDGDFLTESSLKEINETLHYIQHHVTDSYLRKSRADAQGKKRENILTSLQSALPPLPQTRIEANLKLIKDMFIHAYDSYMYHGYPASEVKPITCKPANFNLVKIPGLTLIDSLDTLVILGNYTEFARAVERLRHLNDNGDGLFSINHKVSVFETNIRVLGGLLSAHQLATAFIQGKVLEKDVWAEDKSVLIGNYPKKTKTSDCEEREECDTRSLNSDCDEISTILECKHESLPKTVCHNHTYRHWVYDGFLLDLARDIGDRMLPVFNTPTGIPYGTVNLLTGIPEGETPIASLAGAGTLSLEMELLGRLTGNNEYGRVAKLATRALWMRRSPLGLVGKHICSRRGDWTETLSGIGSNSDSFYEYLIKHHILFPEDADFWLQLVDAYGGLHNETRIGEWYGDVDMYRGRMQAGAPRRVLEALMAFYPGMQVLLGEVAPAARTLNSFFLAREYLGFLPERFQFGAWKVDDGGGNHLLRPELLESAYFLHRASKGFQNHFRSGHNTHSMSDSSGWLWSGDFALHLIEKLTRTKCGYGSPRDVSPETSGKLKVGKSQVRLLDEMPSYFLSETLKYLYLLFDDNNILHTDEERDWVFTTEAHPIHHEQKETAVDDKLLKQKKELKLRIQRRLKKRKKSESYESNGLIEEKWTKKSKMEDYVAQLETLMTNKKKMYQERRARENNLLKVPNSFPIAVERLFPHDTYWSPFDVLNERSQMQNSAYLTFQILGSELKLTNSCPNLYNSDFYWIRALNGGIADYSDAYKSRTDDAFVASERNTIQLGSIDALALHGAGVHIESFYDSFFGCAIRDNKNPNNEKKSDVVKNGVRQGNVGNGSTRFALDNGMGSFDIFAYPGGSGFFVQHVQSGETLVTTFIEADALEDSRGSLILLYAKDGQGNNDVGTSIDNHNPSPTSGFVSRHSGTVVVADVNGNSYSCVVQIIESIMNREEKEEICSIDENGKSAYDQNPYAIPSITERIVMHEFPCSPSLFGPSHISHLQKVKTLEVEAEIQEPDVDDLYGCGRFSTSSSLHGSGKASDRSGFVDPNNNNNNVISIVHRGDCTFQEKSFNKKINHHAEGVIVINTNEGDDFFVMSGGGSEEITTLGNEDYPVTVLVTYDHGQEMLRMMRSHKNGADSQFSARISIVHDRISDDLQVTGNTENEIKFWPRVRASPEGLQIYSKSGWGIHGVQSVVDGESGHVENAEVTWQLYVLKHGMAEDTVP